MTSDYTKDKKINWIRAWLQKFGERDNETFNTEVDCEDKVWKISLQYEYDFDGERYESNDRCSYSFKHVTDNTLSSRTDDELQMIIDILSSRKTMY